MYRCINKHAIISIFLLLLYVSAAAAGKDSIDAAGTSIIDVLKWLWDISCTVFWKIVPICLLVGAAYMVFGGASASAEGQKRIMNVLKGVAALYIGLWLVASIKAL